jgi:hypothetical protein
LVVDRADTQHVESLSARHTVFTGFAVRLVGRRTNADAHTTGSQSQRQPKTRYRSARALTVYSEADPLSAARRADPSSAWVRGWCWRRCLPPR